MSKVTYRVFGTLLFFALGAPFAESSAASEHARFAEFAGKWNGSGVASDSSGWSSSCDVMAFDLIQEADHFEVRYGHYECGAIRGRWKPVVIEIRDDSLWRNGVKIGTIGAGTIHTWARSSDGRLIQDFRLALTTPDSGNADQLEYLETWKDAGSGRELLRVQGRLSRESVPSGAAPAEATE